MQGIEFSIERITRENYHMYDDMVVWRMTGAELTQAEKKANAGNDFTDVFSDLELPGFYAWGALCEGRFVGWITIRYTPKIGRRRWNKGVVYVDELWVAPEYRGNGIAKRLMQKPFDCQEETGADEVRLYVNEDNLVAQGLYKKCGLHAAGKALYMRSGEM